VSKRTVADRPAINNGKHRNTAPAKGSHDADISVDDVAIEFAADEHDGEIDIESVRLEPDLSLGLSAKRLITKIPIRKPPKTVFVRVHPDPAYRVDVGVIELDQDRGTLYVVAKKLQKALSEDKAFSQRKLITAITRQGDLFLWPIRLAGPDERPNDWNDSALVAADEAVHKWVRVTANMAMGAYDTIVAESTWDDPEWPEMSFQAILNVAVRGRLIDKPDHPVIAKLNGRSAKG